MFHGVIGRDAAQPDEFLPAAERADSTRRTGGSVPPGLYQSGSVPGDTRPAAATGRLAAGTRLGAYRVDALIGVGGMGEVYRAHDLELHRDVAIKVLSNAWLADPERRARFDREARALAALNHPNIGAIYGVVDVDGARGLVLEFVPGDTLAEVIDAARRPVTEAPMGSRPDAVARASAGTRRQRGLPLADALRTAVQIGVAIDASHERGIVHRDLKPANIKITPDGTVKVLDFGLAKTDGFDAAVSATADGDTRSGVIMGTVAYMSPEQARGQIVDKRTDIWAFGCVVYETLTGRPAFDGDTLTDVLAAILGREPDWDALPPGTPAQIRRVLRRCLEKDARRRLRDMGDAVVEIEEALDPHHLERGGRAWTPRLRATRWLAAAAGVALAATAAFLVWTRLDRPPDAVRPDPVVVPFTTFPGTERHPTFSPEGDRVAFSWNGESESNYDIYVKLIGPGDPLRLTTSPASEMWPKWSPDGKWIAFLREQPGAFPLGVYIVPALRGAERKLADVSLECLTWSRDGTSLVISKKPAPDRPSGLALLSVETGEITPLTAPVAPNTDRSAAFSPDGATLAFRRFGSENFSSLLLLPMSGAVPQRDGLREAPVPPEAYLSTFAWSADGRELVYGTGLNAENSQLWRMSAAGGSPAARLTFAGEGAFGPEIALRGDRMVFSRFVREINLWSLELDERGSPVGAAVQAFDSSKSESAPAFSPDGRRVAFNSNRSGSDEIWICAADGTECAALTSFGGPHAGEPAWSPDGAWITFEVAGKGGTEVRVVSSSGGRSNQVAEGRTPRWSRDGQWIYYFRNTPEPQMASGLIPMARQIYKVPRLGGTPQQVTRSGGGTAEESPDGRWLYFANSGSLASPLRRIPAAGGAPADVLPAVAGQNFVVRDAGVWYLTPYVPGQGSAVEFFDFASKSSRTVYRTPRQIESGLAVSPDGRRLLFTQIDLPARRDLMLVEQFR